LTAAQWVQEVHNLCAHHSVCSNKYKNLSPNKSGTGGWKKQQRTIQFSISHGLFHAAQTFYIGFRCKLLSLLYEVFSCEVESLTTHICCQSVCLSEQLNATTTL